MALPSPYAKITGNDYSELADTRPHPALFFFSGKTRAHVTKLAELMASQKMVEGEPKTRETDAVPPITFFNSGFRRGELEAFAMDDQVGEAKKKAAGYWSTLLLICPSSTGKRKKESIPCLRYPLPIRELAERGSLGAHVAVEVLKRKSVASV